MRPGSHAHFAAVLLLTAWACTPLAPASPTGHWDATVVVDDVAVPFAFEIATTDRGVQGHFFDGDLRVSSTNGRFRDGALALTFDQYGSTLNAVLKDNRLEGAYDRGTRGVVYPFRAERSREPASPAAPVPQIDGEWRLLLDTPSSFGEASWRLVVRQAGPRVTGAIMRIDGDTGTLTGSFKDGRLVLSHFSGARPIVLDVVPADDGSLRIVQDGRIGMVGVRPTDVRAGAVAAPADPTTWLRVTNPDRPFVFRFPDLDGRMVSNDDPRFQGKVVIVSITGTWCANCHDEAPFLVALYRTHRAKGLEIVALAFEEPAQLKDLSRVRAFVTQFGIIYPFLIAGATEEVASKIPQAVNLNTFPAMFVLGRDGRVRATHAGYASKATGEFYMKEQQQLMKEIDGLLAEK